MYIFLCCKICVYMYWDNPPPATPGAPHVSRLQGLLRLPVSVE